MIKNGGKELANWGILGILVVLHFVINRQIISDLLLIVGLIIGFAMAELDHWLYALMCNPQEVACLRVRGEIQAFRLKNAWEMLQQTKAERTKLPVRNALTGLIVAGLGVWLVTSSGSLLAAGIVFGLNIKLLTDFLTDPDYNKWYWLVARPITPLENRFVKWAWAGLTVIQLMGIIR